MRIMFIIYSLSGGGAERVTVALANHWVDARHEVTIVLLSAADGDDGQAYAVDDRVSIEPLGLDTRSSSVAAALVANRRRIAAIGSVLRSRRPDVVVGMMSTPSILLALARAPRSALRIGTERIYPPFSDLSPLWRAARPLAYARLDAVVAQTEQAADWLRTRSFARRVEVIHNPILEGGRSGPEVSPPSLLPPQSRLLLSVGRLAPQKQFAELLRTFDALARTRPDWHLVILGHGEERDLLEARRRASACAERIHLLGRIANVETWIGRADLFVLASSFEGFPNALLEAYCAGAACVAFDCPTGPSTILTHDEDGILVAPNDFAALTDALGTMMDRPVAREALGARALAGAGRFEIAAIAARWEALFTDLAAHP
ncbi:glycosyltransferase family 4 protein [Methylobacterium planeticum]|uniref:Glycosyltransferase family 4 protein n=1 Tax=Methylobacterium planeticum TaxID=2615211 RepID=A0A6N6MJS2_9HYPH|nr:glycosyltransferase family 4 protein [Methylobacterium planeticum]KAB1070762.1 glycosyltransferase family 4 protein [Methylobacterium planeticum]